MSAWVEERGRVNAVVCVGVVIPNMIAGRIVVSHTHNDFLIIIVKNGEILFK
jgi:hypothetical protein